MLQRCSPSTAELPGGSVHVTQWDKRSIFQVLAHSSPAFYRSIIWPYAFNSVLHCCLIGVVHVIATVLFIAVRFALSTLVIVLPYLAYISTEWTHPSSSHSYGIVFRNGTLCYTLTNHVQHLDHVSTSVHTCTCELYVLMCVCTAFCLCFCVHKHRNKLPSYTHCYA